MCPYEKLVNGEFVCEKCGEDCDTAFLFEDTIWCEECFITDDDEDIADGKPH